MGKAKSKGNRFEREVCKMFQRYYDPNCKREVRSGAVSYLKGDLHFSVNPLNLTIECKNQEKMQFWKWYNQTKEQAGQFEKPILFFTANNKDAVVAMKAEVFMDILDELVGYQRKDELEAINKCEHSKKEWMIRDIIKKAKDYLK